MENVFMISLFCVGLHTLTRESSIFYFWQKVVNDQDLELVSPLFDPLTECIVCMSSLWSCVFLCYYQGIDTMDAVFFILAYLSLLFMDMAIGEKGSGIVKVLYLCLVAIIVLYLKNPIQSFIMITAVAGLNYIFLSISEIAKNSQE